MEKHYRVTITDGERQGLRAMIAMRRAALGCGRATVGRTGKPFVEEGLEEPLERKPSTRVYARRSDGKAEAPLVAITCGAPPVGRSR